MSLNVMHLTSVVKNIIGCIRISSKNVKSTTKVNVFSNLRNKNICVNFCKRCKLKAFFSKCHRLSPINKKSSHVFLPMSSLAFGVFCQLENSKAVAKNGNAVHVSPNVYVLPAKDNTTGTQRSVFWLFVDIFLFVFRSIRLISRFVPFVIFYPFTYISVVIENMWWTWFLYTVEHCGPAFIKLGQWASTRRDLFSEEFCNRFSKLHRQALTHSWSHTQQLMKKAFGKDWRKIFVKMEKNPVGSGCIAQVHKAFMKADAIPDEHLLEEIMDDMEIGNDDTIDLMEGLEVLGFGSIFDYHEQLTAHEEDNHDTELIPVAIKVLHPGVRMAVSRDISILCKLSKVAEWIMPSLKWLSLSECMQEFAYLMSQQLDLKIEAENLETFIHNFEDINFIKFPIPVRPYVRRNVLVETFEEGQHISQYIGLSDNMQDDNPEGLLSKLAEYGADALLQMIFIDNYVHCDLHPGNIIVQHADEYTERTDNKMTMVNLGDLVIVNMEPVESNVKLVLLDTGITASLSEQDWNNFSSVFKAVILGQGEIVAELLLHHARYQNCEDIATFKKDIAQLVSKTTDETLSLGKIQVGMLLSELFRIVSQHKVKLESNFASMVLAIMVLEGLGRSLDPELDLLERAKRVLLP